MKDQLSPEMIMAFKEIPYAFYESHDLVRFISMISTSLLCILYINNMNNPLLLLPITSVILQTVTNILDTYSTVKGFESIEKADEIGIKHTMFEKNKTLGEHPKATNITRNKKSLFLDGASIVIAGLVPPLGIGSSIGRGLIFLSNKRKTQRLNRAIDLKN